MNDSLLSKQLSLSMIDSDQLYHVILVSICMAKQGYTVAFCKIDEGFLFI